MRRTHAWFGLAFALVLLLFAATGFLLNHRSVLKIPALDRQEVVQLIPVESPPTGPPDLAAQLAPSLGVSAAVFSGRTEPACIVQWGPSQVSQPERWTLRAEKPSETLLVEYWRGGRHAEVKRTRPNLWLYLARLHMAVGTGPMWIVMADVAAAGLAFLSVSGFFLWGAFARTASPTHAPARLWAGRPDRAGVVRGVTCGSATCRPGSG